MKKANDCALQHIKVFREQAIRKDTADFGEPCQNCIHVKNCNLNWLSVLSPLIEHSCVEISVVDRGLIQPQDKNPNGIVPGMGILPHMDNRNW